MLLAPQSGGLSRLVFIPVSHCDIRCASAISDDLFKGYLSTAKVEQGFFLVGNDLHIPQPLYTIITYQYQS